MMTKKKYRKHKKFKRFSFKTKNKLIMEKKLHLHYPASIVSPLLCQFYRRSKRLYEKDSNIATTVSPSFHSDYSSQHDSTSCSRGSASVSFSEQSSHNLSSIGTMSQSSSLSEARAPQVPNNSNILSEESKKKVNYVSLCLPGRSYDENFFHHSLNDAVTTSDSSDSISPLLLESPQEKMKSKSSESYLMSCSMVGEISDESLEQRDYTESLESLEKDHQVQCRALMKQNPKKVICGNDQQEGFPELKNDFVPDNVEPDIVRSDFYAHSFSIGFEEVSDLECYTSDVSSACSYPGMDDFNLRQSTTRGDPQEVCELSDIIQNGNCELSDVIENGNCELSDIIQNGNREQENLSSRRRNSQLVSLFEVRGPPESSHLLFPRQFHHSLQTETSTTEIRLQNLHEPTESSPAPESLAEDFDAQHLIISFSGSHDRQEINSGTTSFAGCVQEATNFNNHDGHTSCIDVRPQQGVLALTLSFEHLHVTESNQVESFDIHLGHPGPTVVTNRQIQEHSEQLPFPQPYDYDIAIDLQNNMHREHTLMLESALCCQCLLRPPRAISRPCGHCTFCQICAPAGISCPTCFRHIREFDM